MISVIWSFGLSLVRSCLCDDPLGSVICISLPTILKKQEGVRSYRDILRKKTHTRGSPGGFHRWASTVNFLKIRGEHVLVCVVC